MTVGQYVHIDNGADFGYLCGADPSHDHDSCDGHHATYHGGRFCPYCGRALCPDCLRNEGVFK